MTFVALQAEERLALFEEIIGHGTVWVMTDAAILLDRAVFEDEWPLVAGVAVVAEVVGALICFQQSLTGRTMHFVATAANHLSFFDRMVGGKIGFGLVFLMAAVAEFGFGYFEALFDRFYTLVDLVAVGTGNVIKCVLVPVPFHK